MTEQPLVRRRPREEAREAPEATPRQTYAVPTVLLITRDARFLTPEFSAETVFWHWHADDADLVEDSCFGGDPTDPATYEFIRDVHDVSVLIALDRESTGAVVRAIHQVNPSASLLIVGDEDVDFGTEAPSRMIDWRDALRRQIENELKRLEALKRVEALRSFAEDVAVLPILIHNDPDPDALASALAIRVLLRRAPTESPILTLDEMTRPENERMAELLDIQVTQVTRQELIAFEKLICTDMQPRGFENGDMPIMAVIDHHPPENGYQADYLDIRPQYGATATMLTEYLRVADERWVGRRLATALVYAIKTDTDNLTRGVSPADVEAYTFLLERADTPLLRQIERPGYAQRTAHAFGRGIAEMEMRDDLAVAYLGEMNPDDSHILADVADFCLAMEEATWAAAAAVVQTKLVVNIRHLGTEPGAGDLARKLAEEAGGTGGGHHTMARAVLPLKNGWGAIKDAPPEKARELLLDRLSSYLR